MEIDVITLVFRALAIFGGILIGLFAFQIYKLSKGGLRGWMYISIFGGFLFFWAAASLATSLIGIGLLEKIAGTIGLLGLAFFVPLSYTKICEELNLKRPDFLSTRVSVGFTSLVLMALLLLNVFSPSFAEFPMEKIVSISLFTLGFAMAFALIPLYVLVVNVKKAPWIIALVATVLLSFSLFVGQHYNGCCGEGGEFEEIDELCGRYNLHYIEVTEGPCVGGVVKVGEFYQAYLTIGILLIAFSYYRLAGIFKNLNG